MIRSPVLFNMDLIKSKLKQKEWDFLRSEQHQLLNKLQFQSARQESRQTTRSRDSVTVIKKDGVVTNNAHKYLKNKWNVQDHAAGDHQSMLPKKPLSERTIKLKKLQLINAISKANLSQMFLVVILHQQLHKKWLLNSFKELQVLQQTKRISVSSQELLVK